MGLIVANDIRHIDNTELTEYRGREQEEVLHKEKQEKRRSDQV